MCLVSVVIPYYNSKETLRRTLDSAGNQTFQDFEIITINDGSKDGSEEIVRQYQEEHPHIRLININQQNGGPSKARNQGIMSSKGKYVAFLDSDDTWDPAKLEIQMAHMESNPDVSISGTNYYSNGGEFTKYPETPDLVEADFSKMLFKVFYCLSTVVIRKDILINENLLFLEGKNYGEDLLLFLQIVRKYKGTRISMPLTTQYKYLYGESGLSGDLSKLRSNEFDNLKILHRENNTSEKKISWMLFINLYGYTQLKHYVRIYKSKKNITSR